MAPRTLRKFPRAPGAFRGNARRSRRALAFIVGAAVLIVAISLFVLSRILSGGVPAADSAVLSGPAVPAPRLIFRFRFKADSPVPEINSEGWKWFFFEWPSGKVEKPALVDGGAQFSDGGAYTSADVAFDFSAFVCAFEIAEVRNSEPGVALSFANRTNGVPGFFVTVTRDSLRLENRQTGEILLEARGLALAGADFKKIVVANSPAGTRVSVNGKTVARSAKFLAGTAAARFGIGAAFGGGGEKLTAKLKSMAIFSTAGTPEPEENGGNGKIAAAPRRVPTDFGAPVGETKTAPATENSGEKTEPENPDETPAETPGDSDEETPDEDDSDENPAETPDDDDAHAANFFDDSDDDSEPGDSAKRVPAPLVPDTSPIDPAQRFSDGSTQLHRACANGDAARVRKLLGAGAFPVTLNRAGSTPLHSLCGNAAAIPPKIFAEIVGVLVPAGETALTLRDREGRMPIHILCGDGNFEHAQILIRRDMRQSSVLDREKKSPLWFAVDAGDELFVNFLLAHHADCDAGVPALDLAIEKRNAAIVRKILAAGADVARRGDDGKTPLHRICEAAADFGSEKFAEIVRAIPAAKLDALSIRDSAGSIPLIYLLKHRRFDDARELIAREPRQVNVPDRKRRTPLIYAVAANDKNFVEFLLKNKANPNLVSAGGTSPLSVAVTKNRPEIARVLLAAGANPNVRTANGKTLLDLAEGECAELLRKYSAKSRRR